MGRVMTVCSSACSSPSLGVPTSTKVGTPSEPHLHRLVLDGVYLSDADDAPSIVEVSAPTDDGLHAQLQTIIARLMKMLTRRGVLVVDMGQSWPGRAETQDTMARRNHAEAESAPCERSRACRNRTTRGRWHQILALHAAAALSAGLNWAQLGFA